MPIERLVRRPVATLGPADSCRRAAALMRDENVGAVVIAEEERPLGVVTDRDLAVRVMASGRDPEKVAVREVMSGEPIFLSGPRSFDELVRAMRDATVRRVPIVDAAGQLRGLVSLDDLLLILSDQLAQIAQVVRDEIRPPR